MAASIRAVFFDMDGVLVDVSLSYRRAIIETVAHFTGRTITQLTVQRYKNLGGFNDDWKLTHAIILDSGMEVSLHRVIGEFQRRYRGLSWDGFINDEAPLIGTSTLEALKQRGCFLGIVTGRPEKEAFWTRDRLGWRSLFPLVVAKEQYGRRGKPDPLPILHALGSLRAAGHPLDTQQAVYIGDTVDDMVAARAAGVWAIGFTPPYLDKDSHGPLLTEHGAHYVLDGYDELLEVIDHWSHPAEGEEQ